MKTARWAGRFTRRTGFAPGIALALNLGKRSRGRWSNRLNWMVVGQVYEERVSHQAKQEPGHEPGPAKRGTW